MVIKQNKCACMSSVKHVTINCLPLLYAFTTAPTKTYYNGQFMGNLFSLVTKWNKINQKLLCRSILVELIKRYGWQNLGQHFEVTFRRSKRWVTTLKFLPAPRPMSQEWRHWCSCGATEWTVGTSQVNFHPDRRQISSHMNQPNQDT